jgi:hypothetical protein
LSGIAAASDSNNWIPPLFKKRDEALLSKISPSPSFSKRGIGSDALNSPFEKGKL